MSSSIIKSFALCSRINSMGKINIYLGNSRRDVLTKYVHRTYLACLHPLNCRSLSAASYNLSTINQDNTPSLQMKKRPQRRKGLIAEDHLKSGFWNVNAYSTSDELNLETLTEGLIKQDLYQISSICSGTESNETEIPDVIHAKAKYEVGTESREIYFFREGAVVFWNVPELECLSVVNFIRPFEHSPYEEGLVQNESEIMQYSHTHSEKSILQDGFIFLGSGCKKHLDKYAFSNAVGLSVKLGVWEATLDQYIDSIEFVTEDLKRGAKIKMSREEVLRKTGELFALRHHINLSSDLLDTPDFYWEDDDLEKLYLQMCNYFNISRRTKVMNEKLNHCVELVDLLSSHLNDKHHVRLEWMIIILIMVEVGFEILHYINKYI